MAMGMEFPMGTGIKLPTLEWEGVKMYVDGNGNGCRL